MAFASPQHMSSLTVRARVTESRSGFVRTLRLWGCACICSLTMLGRPPLARDMAMPDVMLSPRQTWDLGEIVMAETLSPHAQMHKTISAFPQKKRMRTWVRGPVSTTVCWRPNV